MILARAFTAKRRSSPYCFTLSIILQLIGSSIDVHVFSLFSGVSLSQQINRQIFIAERAPETLLIFAFNPRPDHSQIKLTFL